MQLSIVTTLYHSAQYVNQFYWRTKNCAAQITDDYEIILVNDGSPDDSIEIALALRESDERHLKVIDLSRNFGHHKALMTGLSYANGDLIFLIDSDLEEEPELLPIFYDEIQRLQTDVVYGVQKKRKGALFEQLTGEVYYSVFNLLTGFNAARNVLTARIMTKEYVGALIEHKEREFDIMGLWSLTGFRQSAIQVHKHSKGATTYNLRRKISLFVNTITAFSVRPLLLIFLLGAGVFAFSLIGAVYVAARQILFAESFDAWIVVLISLWLIGGLILASLGIISLYIAKIHFETKQRPYTIVRKFYGFGE